MVNPHRGEISARINGREETLCLTLGALADLEEKLGAGDLIALTERFSNGRFSARELALVIAAGLRGAGSEMSDTEALNVSVEGGVPGCAKLARDLLVATFAPSESNHANP